MPILLCLATAVHAAPAQRDTVVPSVWPTGLRINDPARPWAIRANAELGGLALLKHTIQFSQDGTELDYVKEGGQGGLFLFARLSAELELYQRHSIIFLYQPLTISTKAVLERDVSIDQLVFPRGTPLDLTYGFDFYRLVYQFDFFRSPRYELAVGLGLQLRNARISFTSADGSLRRIRDNLGPVPLLHVRGRYTFDNGVWLGLEADGFWAAIRGLNGGSTDVEGAIFDVSLRAGLIVTQFMETFVNVRYLGGWAVGSSSSYVGQGDGYNSNYLHTLTFGLGVGLR